MPLAPAKDRSRAIPAHKRVSLKGRAEATLAKAVKKRARPASAGGPLALRTCQAPTSPPHPEGEAIGAAFPHR